MAFRELDETGQADNVRRRAVAIEYWLASALVGGSLIYGLYCGVRSITG